MQLEIVCFQCMPPYSGKEIVATDAKLYKVHINNDNIYHLTCCHGHKTTTLLQNEKYEILYESGLLAFREGFYREAITSFAVSLERFLEYTYSLLLNYNGVLIETRDALQKAIGKLSERQYGVYCAAFAIYTNTEPPTLNSNMTNLRNNVTHNGYIPSRQEADGFGRYVYGFVQTVLKHLCETYSDLKENFTTLALNEAYKKVRNEEAGANPSIMHIPFSIPSLCCPDSLDQPYEEACRKFIQQD